MSESQPLTEDAALRAIVEGVEAEIGERFLSSLVKHLAAALGVQYAFVTEFGEDRTRFRSLALWARGALAPNFEVPLDGTPCEAVLNGQMAHHPRNLQTLFPKDTALVDWKAESYCGVPMTDSSGSVVGHLAIVDDKPMLDGPRGLAIMRIFAARAVAEIERLRAEAESRKSDLVLRAVVEGVESEVGERFFALLVERLAKALGVQYAYVSELSEDQSHFRSRAGWGGNRPLPQFRVPDGGPCEAVLSRRVIHHADQLPSIYPHVKVIADLGAVSYCGVPVVDFSEKVVGHLAVMDTKPMPDVVRVTSILGIFASRACAEIERLRAEVALRESEERLSRVFGSAMDAIITLDEAFCVEICNDAAEKVFGLNAQEILGRPFDPFLSAQFREALANCVRAFDSGESQRYMWAPEGLTARRANGEEFPIEATISQIEMRGRRLYTVILRDINERKKAEAELGKLQLANVYLQEEIRTEHNFEEIVGSSALIKKVFKAVATVAATDSTVLITGETGTGKELIARAIHNISSRKDRVLVKVNCAAIPAGLIESELFGHEKGAFTGALTRKIGRFELADGATIFLDEIGELPLDLQSKLLRVLQEGEFERVGSSKTMKVDARVIAATNRDLEKATQEGNFRSDLYYRVNVFPIRLPALRERKEDIPRLVSYFARKYGTKMGKKIETIPQAVGESLKAYAWPGNIRELENVIERAVILTQGTALEMGDWLPKQAAAADGSRVPSLEELERTHIIGVLERTGWRVSGEKGAAKILGLKPTTLEARMKKLGITRKAS